MVGRGLISVWQRGWYGATHVFLEPENRSWSVDQLLDALGNPNDRKILSLAQQRPVDAQEIMEVTGFPKSTVYRRLRELEDCGLLVPCSGVVRNGHAVERYRCCLDDISVRLVDGQIEVSWDPGTSPPADRGEDRRYQGAPPPIGVANGTTPPERSILARSEP